MQADILWFLACATLTVDSAHTLKLLSQPRIGTIHQPSSVVWGESLVLHEDKASMMLPKTPLPRSVRNSSRMAGLAVRS
jgi:hypothetical protein